MKLFGYKGKYFVPTAVFFSSISNVLILIELSEPWFLTWEKILNSILHNSSSPVFDLLMDVLKTEFKDLYEFYVDNSYNESDKFNKINLIKNLY